MKTYTKIKNPDLSEMRKMKTPEEICELVKIEYDKTGTAPLRYYFYRLVTLGHCENIRKEYKRISNILARAREDEILPWQIMIDQEREKNGYPPFYSSPLQKMKWIIDDLSNFNIKINPWFFQQNYIEIWCEKKTLNPFLIPFCTKLKIIYVASHGYTSVTFLNDTAKRLSKIKKPITILYVGDFDPSGKDIPRNIKAKIKKYCGKTINLITVCLTKEQIIKYNLPQMMTKERDSRRQKFVSKYGDIAVEIDALHPTIIKHYVAKEIFDNLFDWTIEDRRREWENAERLYVAQELPRRVKKLFQ